MTKLEELKAALAAVTQGKWVQNGHCVVVDNAVSETQAGCPYRVVADCQDDLVDDELKEQAHAHLIALMKNNLLTLIECAEIVGSMMRDTGLKVLLRPDQVRRAEHALSKLKA